MIKNINVNKKKDIDVEIWPIGGYSECGRNMTAVKVGDEFVILDIGLNMEKVAESDLEIHLLSPKELKLAGALPDDSMLKPFAKQVKAIVVGHAHLDHVGAVPKMAYKTYDCPVIGTPFTIQVLRNLIREEKYKPDNRLISMNNGSTFKVSENITVEFVKMTHST
ncbi:MAG: MBL fold metallo-hydrolase, partial [Candidatus Omnitrophica bacterium]|nr:MBL fold metallo-hydrolase [Candidatus Omnitrophota bacterium]